MASRQELLQRGLECFARVDCSDVMSKQFGYLLEHLPRELETPLMTNLDLATRENSYLTRNLKNYGAEQRNILLVFLAYDPRMVDSREGIEIMREAGFKLYQQAEMRDLARIAKRTFNSFCDPAREVFDLSVLEREQAGSAVHA